MKVLYVVSAYPRHSGDVITPWLVRTIEGLKERGVHVEVLAPAYRGMGTGDVDGVPVHRFRYAPAPWETLTHDQTAPDRIRRHPQYLGLLPSYLASGSLAAARLARSGRFDLLHAFWPLPHGLLGLWAKRRSGVPLVSTFFGVELTWMRRQFPAVRPLLRRIVRGSDAVTVISSHTERLLREAVPEARPVRIPFGAAVSPAVNPPPPFPAGREERPVRLLFVGRLVRRKGVHVLLDAVARLPADLDVHLTVVGSGPEAEPLRQRAGGLRVTDRVAFTGGVGRDRLERAFRECDVLILPAVYDEKGDVEGLGVVLIEALAHGRPVIGSDAGGIPDVIRHGETGLLVPPDDALALAGAIERLASDPARARQMGAAGRVDVTRRFGWPVLLDELVDLYRRTRTILRPPPGG